MRASGVAKQRCRRAKHSSRVFIMAAAAQPQPNKDYDVPGPICIGVVDKRPGVMLPW